METQKVGGQKKRDLVWDWPGLEILLLHPCIEWTLFFLFCFVLFVFVLGFFWFSFCFLGPYLWHMEVPSIGVESELQLLAYVTPTAAWDLGCVCDAHHCSRQRRILNPLSEARDQATPSWKLVGFVSATPQRELLLSERWASDFTSFAPISWLALLLLVFSGLRLRHMEVPRLGVKLELQLPAYTTATATGDPSPVFDLRHSSWQRRIPDPLSEAGGWIWVLMDTSQVHYHCAPTGTADSIIIKLDLSDSYC